MRQRIFFFRSSRVSPPADACTTTYRGARARTRVSPLHKYRPSSGCRVYRGAVLRDDPVRLALFTPHASTSDARITRTYAYTHPHAARTHPHTHTHTLSKTMRENERRYARTTRGVALPPAGNTHDTHVLTSHRHDTNHGRDPVSADPIAPTIATRGETTIRVPSLSPSCKSMATHYESHCVFPGWARRLFPRTTTTTTTTTTMTIDYYRDACARSSRSRPRSSRARHRRRDARTPYVL